MVPKRRRPPGLSGEGLKCPKAEESPSPQRRGPRWSQSERGPLASAAGASMVPKPRRPHRLSGAGLNGAQSGGGPPASAAGASVIRKRRRPPGLSGGGLGGLKAKETPSPQWQGAWWSQSQGDLSPQQLGPQWSQSQGGPRCNRTTKGRQTEGKHGRDVALGTPDLLARPVHMSNLCTQ